MLAWEASGAVIFDVAAIKSFLTAGSGDHPKVREISVPDARQNPRSFLFAEKGAENGSLLDNKAQAMQRAANIPKPSTAIDNVAMLEIIHQSVRRLSSSTMEKFVPDWRCAVSVNITFHAAGVASFLL